MLSSRTINASGSAFRPAAPFTSIAPFVRSQIVIMPGTPSETKSMLPEISASFITSEERNVFHSIVMSPRPTALACFSTSFWSSISMY